MRVKVLFFGSIADIVGSREILIEAEKQATAKSIVDKLSARYPSLAVHNLLVAINEEYVDLETRVERGDEVAVFTAVSGG